MNIIGDRFSEELESYELEMAPKTYGVAQDQPVDVDVHSAHSNGEGDALLGNDATPRIHKREGDGTIHSSVGNLANTIIGSGAWAVPSPEPCN